MIFGSSRRNLDFSKLFDYNTPPIWERPQDGPPVTEEMPMPNGPRFGGGSMGNPDGILSLGGYDRNAAMQGQSGFSPMNQGQPAKKPGFFGQGGIGRSIAGTIGDVLLQRNGNAPIYAPAMRQKSELMQRQQQAEQQRMQEREDFLFREQYKRANPATRVNDTEQDYNFWKGKLDAGEITPEQFHDRVFPARYVLDQATGQQIKIGGIAYTPAPQGVTFTPIDDGGQVQPAPATFPGQ